jgi:DNA-binding transcriptional regulator YiaG
MNNAEQACWSCGSRMTDRLYEHVEQVGKIKVSDKTAFARQCAECGEVDLSLKELAGYQRRAAAIVLREAPHIKGLHIRYARKALGVRQVDLARIIGCEAETLSRYENDTNPMPRATQLAIVAVLDEAERNGGNVQAMIDREVEDGARPSIRSLEVTPPVTRTG